MKACNADWLAAISSEGGHATKLRRSSDAERANSFVPGLLCDDCVILLRVRLRLNIRRRANRPLPASAGQVKPEDVLRQMADYLGNLPAFSCKVEVSARRSRRRTRTTSAVTKMTVRLQRPNQTGADRRRRRDGTHGRVATANSSTQYLPMMKRYVVREAPATFAEMTDIGVPISITMSRHAGDVIPTGGDEFFKRLMDGVDRVEVLGQGKSWRRQMPSLAIRSRRFRLGYLDRGRQAARCRTRCAGSVEAVGERWEARTSSSPTS